MFVSCLCPTFNRCPDSQWLLEEAVESFLRQDYLQKELIICNDTPGQVVKFNHPQVLVLNLATRLPDLSTKISLLLSQAQGEAFCRWDDDDISLPWRLTMSVQKLFSSERPEWRADNYWYDPIRSKLREVAGAGNTHVASIFTRGALKFMPEGVYPQRYSGGEDQRFNELLGKAGFGTRGELLKPSEIYYLYRWGVSPTHLSGKATPGVFGHQSHWDEIGKNRRASGVFTLKPHWRVDHAARARLAAESATPGD